MVFLKDFFFFEEVDFKKNPQMTKKKMKNYPACKELNYNLFVHSNMDRHKQTYTFCRIDGNDKLNL